jgi:predicted esterase
MGFSQGACLSLEYAARNPCRYGGVVGFSGGLIGNGQIPGVDPPADKRFDYAGWLDATPVFLGCSDVDPHIPLQRVLDSAEVLEKLGADVTRRIYPGMPHTINDDEIAFAADVLDAVAAG